jgi:putative protease
MCFAFSGRCLISSLQSGRVPNRGSCANDCRFPYTLYAENPETGTLFKLEEQPEVGTYIMNAKDLNLAGSIDEILKSGVVDSVKIEGRTKSPYYTAITTKTYRKAINDFYQNKFNPNFYMSELNTTQNRGFTDAYLIHKPFEKNNTQNETEAMVMGTHQVAGIVTEDQKFFHCKYKIYPNDELELVFPENKNNFELIKIIKTDIGEVYIRDEVYFLKLFKIMTESGKELESVHSGNLNRIVLPTELPAFTFFRYPIEPEKVGKKVY